MRKALRIFLSLVVLSILIFQTALADIPAVDLSTLSLDELNLLRTDINTEIKAHHETDSKAEERVLNAVKLMTERYYSEKGIKISWAWHSWEYAYSRNGDYLTLSTHLDYEDEEKKGHRVKVFSELYFDGISYNVFSLKLDQEQVFVDENKLPESLIIDTDSITINEKTGINLSLLRVEELKELERMAQKEIDTNHTPRNTGKVHDALKKTVEDHFSALGVTVNWPWFDYNYTCDWDCYTETTRITYELDGKRHQNEQVYAEIFPDAGQYRVYYLVIDDKVLFDDRSKATNENALFFLKKRVYAEAMRLYKAMDYEKAFALFEELGDFDDSPIMKQCCVDALNQRQYEEAQYLYETKQYEEAIAIFNSLGEYSDSKQRADQCRDAIKEIQYLGALALMECENFEQAIKEFSEILDYKDSQQKIVDCQAGITENAYDHALELMSEGKYEEAIAIFEALNGYAESDANISACHAYINSQNYTEADALYSSGDYAAALSAFTLLGEYRDSKERAAQLQEIVASIDRKITLSESEVFTFQGKKVVIRPTVEKLYQDASDDVAVVFSTSDQTIAKVGKDGTVTPVKIGDVTIRCEAANNPYIMAEVVVHVVKSVNRIVLSSTKLQLSIPEQNGNSSTQLSYKVDPEDAYVKSGVWSSSNEKVATVDQNGNVKAIGTGRATITFTSDDNSKGKKTATCNVSVVQAVTSLEFAETSGLVYVGKTVQLKPKVLPQNAANKKLTWTSSDESIATVNANGQIKGIAPGAVVITAYSSDGPSISYNATVKIQPVTLKVTGTATCIAKNHVGNNWSKTFYLNKYAFKGTGKVTVENGDSITVGCRIMEDDSSPDIDGFDVIIDITPEIMTKGTKIERTVYVTEDGGRYSGNSAIWEVVINIRP